MSAYLALVRTELKLSMRQGEQLLVALGIPLLLLVFFSLVDVLPTNAAEPVDFLAPSILALAVMSSGMVSLAIATGFERYYGVLKRLGATPLGRPRLVAAKISSVLAMLAIQIAVIVVAASLLGWSPDPQPVTAVAAIVLGTAAFCGIGLFLAGTLSGPLTLAVANGLYIVLLLLGGVVFPLDELPGALAPAARLLPSSALSETLQGALRADIDTSSRAWVTLVLWAVAAPTVAAVTFRWSGD